MFEERVSVQVLQDLGTLGVFPVDEKFVELQRIRESCGDTVGHNIMSFRLVSWKRSAISIVWFVRSD